MNSIKKYDSDLAGEDPGSAVVVAGDGMNVSMANSAMDTSKVHF